MEKKPRRARKRRPAGHVWLNGWREAAERYPANFFWNHLSIFGSTLGDRREFRQVLAFIESSKLKPVIDRVFSLRDAAAAQRYMEEGNEFGKIVLRIAE